VPRYKLTIAYDGTDFCGWQKQFPHADAVPTAPRLGAEPPSEANPGAEGAPGGAAIPGDDPSRPRVELRTVQGVVERAVRHVVREPVTLMGSSRTDAGVHARGQVAAFTCSDAGGRTGGWPEDRGSEPLRRAINSRLPHDVLVLGAEPVGPSFDPIGDTLEKAYSYTVHNAPDRPLWDRRTALHVYSPLDAARMDAAARLFVGEHDFGAFAAAGHGRLTTVRTVTACSVRAEPLFGGAGTPAAPAWARRVVIDISGTGFLWNMVRIIAGTLCEVGRGRMGEGTIREALRTGTRALAGPTLPPQGLCLEWIRYGEGSGGAGAAEARV
jgi:tRNA pseudouridine38-40 synthase